jgi:hypothetical protein
MTKVLTMATNKVQSREGLSSKLSISKKSRIVKRNDKKVVEIKNECRIQRDVWDIGSILSNIFTYVDRKDLVEFNTVCKKWNHVTNPIIHKTIKLIHNTFEVYENGDKIDTEVIECISNNAKYAPFVKEFKYNYKLNPQRAIEVFETFRFICNLTIEHCGMSQDQFLSMISPLTHLQELSINEVYIENIIVNRPCKGAVQLPSTLKKLRLKRIKLINDPELFVQTINSHSNLVEFSSLSQSSYDYLKPFYIHYPSLLNFSYSDCQLETPKLFFTIFENNPQLINLELSLENWNNEYINCINYYLANLEELNLKECNLLNHYCPKVNFKLSQPTKIKKLKLEQIRLSNCSLNSILHNCPHLEELDLNPYIHYKQPNSVKFPNLSNPAKLKKISIDCGALAEGVIDTLLSNSPCLNELNIILPYEWKEVIKSVYEKCANLEKLYICRSFQTRGQERGAIFQEFYETEFFTRNPKCISTLTHLTLNGFKVSGSKAEYFKNFSRLKYIRFLNQLGHGFYSFNRVTEVDMSLWPGYRLLKTIVFGGYDAELKKH